MYREIKTKFSNMIRQAFYSTVDSDSSAYPQGQATTNKKITKFTRLSVYGICSNPPKDSHILLFNSQAQESIKFGIQNDFLNRLKDLKEGEVALFNTKTKSVVLLNSSGGVIIGNSLLPMISTPPRAGVDVIEILDRILTLLQGTLNLPGVASGATFLPSVITELTKLQIDLNSIKGDF